MTATIDNQSFILDARRLTTEFLNSYTQLLAMQGQWNALNYGTTLMDGSGVNTGVTAAMVGAGIFAGMNAITTALGGGVATNLYQLMQN